MARSKRRRSALVEKVAVIGLLGLSLSLSLRFSLSLSLNFSLSLRQSIVMLRVAAQLLWVVIGNCLCASPAGKDADVSS